MSTSSADKSGPMQARERMPAEPSPLSATAIGRATRKWQVRREEADRLAIERGEDEGMIVRTGNRVFAGQTTRGQCSHANAHR